MKYILENSKVVEVTRLRDDLYRGEIGGLVVHWDASGKAITNWEVNSSYDIFAPYEGSLLQTIEENHTKEL